MFGWFKKKEVQASKSPESELGNAFLQNTLIDLLRSHGLIVTEHEGWAVVNEDLPILRGIYKVTRREPSVTVQMDIELCLAENRIIWEHYAGLGETEKQALGEAIYKFCRGAFHVFLSTFWNHHEPDQVDIETWTINDAPWDVYVGAMIEYASEGQVSGFPGNYMPVVEAAIRQRALLPQDHWFSFFGSNLEGEITVDSYFDNEKWPELNEQLAALDWPPATGFYSARNFMLLRPASAQSLRTTFPMCSPESI